MNKLLFSLILTGIVLISCNTTPVNSGDRTARGSSQNFSQVTGKEWKLTGVRVSGADSGFDRDSLAREGFGEWFTLNFDSEVVSGTGAPNRYSAPYTRGSGRNISVMMVRSTLMASIFEPPHLKEQDYFTYLQNVSKWNLNGNTLEFNTKSANNAKVVLIFTQE